MLRTFRLECEQFDIEKSEIPLFDEMASDLKSYENNWLLYEEFNVGLQEMADEEWILFRQVPFLRLRFTIFLRLFLTILTTYDYLVALRLVEACCS